MNVFPDRSRAGGGASPDGRDQLDRAYHEIYEPQPRFSDYRVNWESERSSTVLIHENAEPRLSTYSDRVVERNRDSFLASDRSSSFYGRESSLRDNGRPQETFGHLPPSTPQESVSEEIHDGKSSHQTTSPNQTMAPKSSPNNDHATPSSTGKDPAPGPTLDEDNGPPPSTGEVSAGNATESQAAIAQTPPSINDVASPTQQPASTSGVSTAPSDAPSVEIFKSFRVGLEDPCWLVLPHALRKYNITDDWRQYSLLIVYGDQERHLKLDEKPLAVFKELDGEGKKPMFMLRKMAQLSEPLPGSTIAIHVETVRAFTIGSVTRTPTLKIGGKWYSPSSIEDPESLDVAVQCVRQAADPTQYAFLWDIQPRQHRDEVLSLLKKYFSKYPAKISVPQGMTKTWGTIGTSLDLYTFN